MLNHLMHRQNNSNLALIVNKLCIFKIIVTYGDFYTR
jgi:hypothetical protein